MSSQIDTRIYNQAKKMGINDTLARLIVAQARHETNDYKSRLFNVSNNAFGYKYVGQKKWANGESPVSPPKSEGLTGYANYPSVEYSVGELVDWLRRREKNGLFTLDNLTNSQIFADSLKRGGYYGDTIPNYTRGLDSALKKVVIVGGSITAILLVIGFFFW